MRGFVGALLAAFALSALAQDPTLDRARQLVLSKQAQAAFDLLSPHEAARAGQPDFDYLLGLAAIDAGQLTRGVFALERVLAVRPDHPQARAEIARAYFLMGENKVARQEFEAVRQSRPPAEVTATVDRFLNALDARERARHTGITGYLEAGLGHDTNANAATSSTQFAIPLFAGFIFNLDESAAKQDDSFLSLAGGVNGRYGFDDTFGIVGSASFDRRFNSKLDEFDTGSLNGSVGLSVRRQSDEFIAAVQLQSYTIDNDRFRQAAGVLGQWRRNLSAADQVSAYIQHTRLTYPGQSVRNAERNVLGGAWAHSYGGARNAVSFAGAYIGRESEMAQNVPQFGHDLWGLRLGGQVSLTEKWTLAVQASYEDRRYGGPDPLFLRKRHDREAQLRIAGVYAVDRFWSITPALAFTDTQSNIVVNEFDRRIASVTVRRDFR